MPFVRVNPGADNDCPNRRCTFNCPPSCEDVADAESPELRCATKLLDASDDKDAPGGDVVCGAQFIFKCCPAP